MALLFARLSQDDPMAYQHMRAFFDDRKRIRDETFWNTAFDIFKATPSCNKGAALQQIMSNAGYQHPAIIKKCMDFAELVPEEQRGHCYLTIVRLSAQDVDLNKAALEKASSCPNDMPENPDTRSIGGIMAKKLGVPVLP